jgi:hypothetical protein
MIFYDTIFLCQIRKDLKKDPFVIGMQGQLSSQHQVQKNSSDHVKFGFQNGLLYHDGLLYVLNGFA